MHFFTRQCLCPLVRLDSACAVHSYDSTTYCLGPSLKTTCLNLLSLPNEMHFSTRQYSLSTRQCLCPLVRLDNACVHSYDSYDSTTYCLGPSLTTTCLNLLSLPNEMHFSTRQYLCPLVRLVRLDKRFLGPLLWTPCINLLSLPNEMHFSTRPPSYTTRHNSVHIPNQMHFFKVNS